MNRPHKEIVITRWQGSTRLVRESWWQIGKRRFFYRRREIEDYTKSGY